MNASAEKFLTATIGEAEIRVPREEESEGRMSGSATPPAAIYVWLVPSEQVLEQPGSWRIRKWDTEPFPEANFHLRSAVHVDPEALRLAQATVEDQGLIDGSRSKVVARELLRLSPLTNAAPPAPAVTGNAHPSPAPSGIEQQAGGGSNPPMSFDDWWNTAPKNEAGAEYGLDEFYLLREGWRACITHRVRPLERLSAIATNTPKDSKRG